MNKNYIYGIGIALAVLLVFAASATARTDDVTFYLNTSDGSHEVSVAPGEEVTIYMDARVPVNSSCGFEAGLMIDPDVLECVDVTENVSLTDWYMWDFWGVWDSGFEDGKKYINFCSWDPLGIEPGLLRCADIRVKGVNPGTTILYLGKKDIDIEDGNNNTMTIDYEGDSKDWTLAENFTFTCIGSTPDPTETATPDPTETAIPDPTETAIPDPTETAIPDPTETATPDPTETAIPDPTETAIPDPTETATPDPTETAIPDPTETTTPEPTETTTPEPTETTTPEPTETTTPEPTEGPTEIPEFSTIVIPIIGILGLMLLLSRRK